jgi:hypothetical protein
MQRRKCQGHPLPLLSREQALNASGGVLVPAAARCCTFDLTAEELEALCALQDIQAGWPPAQTAAEWHSAGPPAYRSALFHVAGADMAPRCAAQPATLAGMAELVSAAGRRLIPEQKHCDLLCQAKLLTHPANRGVFPSCVPGAACPASTAHPSAAPGAVLHCSCGNGGGGGDGAAEGGSEEPTPAPARRSWCGS